MGDKILKVVSGLIGLAVIIWIVSNVISSQHAANEQEREKLETKIQIEQGISDMVIEHNAVIIDWKKSFGRENLPREIYDIEVEEVLIRSDGRPVLFFGYVENITRRDERYFVHFIKEGELAIGLGIRPEVHFILECNPGQVKKIRDQPTKMV